MTYRVTALLATSGGGTGRHVAALAAELVEHGVEVTVAGPPAGDAGFGFSATGVSFVSIEISDRPQPSDFSAVWRLRRLFRASDVVHAHGVRAGALAVLAARSVRRRNRPPVVVTVHNALVAGGRTAAVYGILAGIVARGADVVLVVSPDLAERMRELGAGDVRRALVPAPIRRAGRERAAVRTELGVDDEQTLLLTVARLAPQKGLPALLDAVEVLREGRLELHLVVCVVGEGPLRAALTTQIGARRLPIRLLGERHDVPDLLGAADLVVVPSVWEGQPLIVQEALRAGKAIIATDVGGVRDLTGEAAELVASGRPQRLAEVIAALLDDPARVADLERAAALRGAGLPTAADAFAQVNELYLSLITKRR